MRTLSQLAVEGGRPVRERALPYGRQEVTGEDIAAVTEVLRSDWLTTGPRVAAFEEAVAARVGAREAVAFSSGTAALHAAVYAAGLQPGDQAVTTPLSFCATANALLHCRVTPVFADVREETLSIDPDAARRAVTSRTRLILGVDYAGHPADWEALQAVARERGLITIDDAAQAFGAVNRGRPIGSIADMTVFSFHPTKTITTGEGGMVTTNRPDWIRALRRFRNHGLDKEFRERQREGDWRYGMVELGLNYRLSEMGAALGLSQLGRLDAILARRRAIAERYAQAFSAWEGLRLLEAAPEREPAWHLYPIRLEPGRFRVDRDGFFRALLAEGLGVNVHYLPIYRHPYYRERFGDSDGCCPRAEAASETLITLPLFQAMREDDVEDVIEAVTKVAGHYAV